MLTPSRPLTNSSCWVKNGSARAPWLPRDNINSASTPTALERLMVFLRHDQDAWAAFNVPACLGAARASENPCNWAVGGYPQPLASWLTWPGGEASPMEEGRTIAVGDIHGCSAALAALLRAADL